ncbi:hypothetical protein D3C86_1339110 [compost metagenome]
MMMPMILERRRLRFTAKILGLKPDFFSASSMASRVFLRTEAGSLKYFETVGRERPTNSENSSIVLIDLAKVLAPMKYYMWYSISTGLRTKSRSNVVINGQKIIRPQIALSL